MAFNAPSDVSLSIVYVVPAESALSVFTSARAKRLGDYVANTVVVKERAAEAPKFDEIFESEVIDTAMRRVAAPVDFQGEVRAVTSSEILAVESFLRRRYDIPEHPRMWLAWRIAMPLLEKIRPYYDPTTFSYEPCPVITKCF